MKQAHLIDISAVFFRYYFAPGPSIVTDDGWEVYPLLASLRWLVQPRFIQSDVTVAAFDESLGTCFRHELDPHYKANRAMPNEDILYQLSLLKSFCEHLGFVVLAGTEFEADDYLATSVALLPEHEVTLHSRDKDLRQLLTTNVIMQDNATEAIWDVERLKQEVGLAPNQIVDFLSLVGDASDFIEGVSGIGVKTATSLLQTYGDYQGIYRVIDSNASLSVRGAERIAQSLIDQKDRVLLNRQLIELRKDIPISLTALPFDQDGYFFVYALVEQLGLMRPFNKQLEILAGLHQ
ncbi:hypothetical protein NBRC116188_05150 [Oceaniserpentilla sp. 4NH20-0058]|uniref:5'-3' exonuclease n=1 Tax=Oceaniserpentilla sp. 4NH20-0058 TaxID=3127660 RepID=UPI0031097E45